MGVFPIFVKNNGSFFQGWKWYGSPRWSSLLMHIYYRPPPPTFNSSTLYSMKILFSLVCSCCLSSILMDSYLLVYFTTNASCRCRVALLPYALRPLQETFQAWQPSVVQTQLLPWSCFALWAKEIPTGTSLSPHWASAQPWRWFIWELKGRRRLRCPR